MHLPSCYTTYYNTEQIFGGELSKDNSPTSCSSSITSKSHEEYQAKCREKGHICLKLYKFLEYQAKCREKGHICLKLYKFLEYQAKCREKGHICLKLYKFLVGDGDTKAYLDICGLSAFVSTFVSAFVSTFVSGFVSDRACLTVPRKRRAIMRRR
eukprot:sb/3473223/